MVWSKTAEAYPRQYYRRRGPVTTNGLRFASVIASPDARPPLLEWPKKKEVLPLLPRHRHPSHEDHAERQDASVLVSGVQMQGLSSGQEVIGCVHKHPVQLLQSCPILHTKISADLGRPRVENLALAVHHAATLGSEYKLLGGFPPT